MHELFNYCVVIVHFTIFHVAIDFNMRISWSNTHRKNCGGRKERKGMGDGGGTWAWGVKISKYLEVTMLGYWRQDFNNI